nr:hypothetical protein [Nocardia coffeae]
MAHVVLFGRQVSVVRWRAADRERGLAHGGDSPGFQVPDLGRIVGQQLDAGGAEVVRYGGGWETERRVIGGRVLLLCEFADAEKRPRNGGESSPAPIRSGLSSTWNRSPSKAVCMWFQLNLAEYSQVSKSGFRNRGDRHHYSEPICAVG